MEIYIKDMATVVDVKTGVKYKQLTGECPQCLAEFKFKEKFKDSASCPICSKLGHTRKAILYYFKIKIAEDQYVWKIGISYNKLDIRYTISDVKRMSEVKTWTFNSWHQAKAIEGRILQEYQLDKYYGDTFFTNKTGITEVFIKDIYDEYNSVWPTKT